MKALHDLGAEYWDQKLQMLITLSFQMVAS